MYLVGWHHVRYKSGVDCLALVKTRAAQNHEAISSFMADER